MLSFKKFLKEHVLVENARYKSDVRERFIPYAWNVFMEYMLAHPDKKLTQEFLVAEIVPQLLLLLEPTEETKSNRYSDSVTNEVNMINNFKKKNEIIQGLKNTEESASFLFKLFSTLMSNFAVTSFDKKTVAKLRIQFIGRGDSSESVQYSETFTQIINKIKAEQAQKNDELAKQGSEGFAVGKVDVVAQRKVTPKANFTAYDSKAQIAFYQPELGTTIFASGKILSKAVATLALNNISKNTDEMQDKLFKTVETALHKELSDFTQLDMSDEKANSVKKTRENLDDTASEYELKQIDEMDNIHNRISDAVNKLFSNDTKVTKTVRNEFIRLSLTGDSMFNDKKYEANTRMSTSATGETAIAVIDDHLIETISGITDIRITYKNGASSLYLANNPVGKKEIKKGKSPLGPEGDVADSNKLNKQFGENTLMSLLNTELKLLKEDMLLTESIVSDTKELFATMKRKVKSVVDKLIKKAKELINKGIVTFLNFFGVIIDNVIIDGADKVDQKMYEILATGTKPTKF
jgi:hypothetical protein